MTLKYLVVHIVIFIAANLPATPDVSAQITISDSSKAIERYTQVTIDSIAASEGYTQAEIDSLNALQERKRAAARIDESSLDVHLFRFLNGSLANPAFDMIMPIITDFDKWKVILLLVWAALVFFGGSKGRWAALMLIPLVAASDQLTSSVIKPLTGRFRPCEVLGSIHLWYGPEGWITTPAEIIRSYKGSFCFPSGHAANMTASMLFLGLVYRRWLVPLLVIAVAVSYSRVYIGVHWPSDVLVGAAIGALLAWPSYLIYKTLHREGREEISKGDQPAAGKPAHS